MGIDPRVLQFRRRVAKCKDELAYAKEDVKAKREALKDAEGALYRAIDDAEAGVQDLPFDEPEEDEAEARNGKPHRRKPKEVAGE